MSLCERCFSLCTRSRQQSTQATLTASQRTTKTRPRMITRAGMSIFEVRSRTITLPSFVCLEAAMKTWLWGQKRKIKTQLKKSAYRTEDGWQNLWVTVMPLLHCGAGLSTAVLSPSALKAKNVQGYTHNKRRHGGPIQERRGCSLNCCCRWQEKLASSA